MTGNHVLRGTTAFAAGLLFAVGLGVSGMVKPSKVIGFLDLFGRWDASLAFVMGGAVLVGLVAHALILRRSRPLLAPTFHVPANEPVDRTLVAGAAIFGCGWGLVGVCPGPGIVAAVTGAPAFLVFLATMAAGVLVAGRLDPEE